MASQQPKILTSFEFKTRGRTQSIPVHPLLMEDERFGVIVDPSTALPSMRSIFRLLFPTWLRRCKCTMQYHQLQGRSSSSRRCKSNTTSMDRQRRRLRVHLSRVAGCPILGDVTFTKETEDRHFWVQALASFDRATIAHWGTIGEKGRVHTGLLINKHSRIWVLPDSRCNSTARHSRDS